VVPLGGDHIIVRGSDEGTAFRRRYAIDDRARVILHVGGCDERKNVRVLLLALNEVRQGPGDVILVHIGDAFGSEDWRVVEEFQLQPSLRLIVNAAAEDLAAAYAAADVVVIPSIYEGFGLPAVEAMAAGTPVVGLRAAALSEVIGEAGLLVDENTPAAFADALSKVLNDPEQRQILSRRGKERAACFTWERTARLTDEVYHRIIEGM
jgi:glycosyltransferase involved in cell wall biosynthesis